MTIITFLKESSRIQLAVWPIYFVVTAFITYKINPAVSFTAKCAAVTLLIIVLNASTMVFYFLLWKQSISKFIILTLLIYMACAEGIQWISQFWSETIQERHTLPQWHGDTAAYYWNLLHKYLGVLIMALALVLHIRSRESLRKKYEKALEAAGLEAALHVSVLDKHFLYNTLHRLSLQTGEVLPHVTQSLRPMVRLLRYMAKVIDSKIRITVISHEIAAMKHYIALEQSRYSVCYVEIKIEGDECGQKIPPAIMIPLAENAFKYGVTKDPDRPVRIHIFLEPDRIQVTFSNAIDLSNRNQSGTGIGLRHVRKRLDMEFPNAYGLEVDDDGKHYTLRLTINQK